MIRTHSGWCILGAIGDNELEGLLKRLLMDDGKERGKKRRRMVGLVGRLNTVGK